jgi:hypothetical protein
MDNFTVNNAIATTSTVNGLFTNNGNTVLGDTNADIVTINAKIASNQLFQCKQHI